MSQGLSSFTVGPQSGTVKPRSSCHAVVRWTPSAAPQMHTSASTAAAQAVPAVPTATSGGEGRRQAQAQKGVRIASISATAAAAGNSAVTVELQGDPAQSSMAKAVPPTTLAQPACVAQSGFMTCRLRGGGDALPKRVLLHGELRMGLLKFKEKDLDLGPVPVGVRQGAVVLLRNIGTGNAAFRVCA
jgi:hypothetical protein